MTKRTRTILFFICLFLFLLVAPSIVLYSQGYRIDFDSKRITQTGGLFLKILPKQVEVYLGGKLKEKTDFFFGSILIENLLPKKYKIEVKKTGFYPWEKTLEIKEKEVIEAKNIVLFPENLNFSELSKGVEKFWFSPDQKKIVLLEKDKIGWALKLYGLDKNVKSHLTNEGSISRKGADLLDLKFAENSKEISLELGITEEVKYFSLALDKTPPALSEIEAPATSSENIIATKKFNNDIYRLDNSGFLFKNEEKITEKSFPIKPETKYNLYIFSDYIFLRKDQTLYLLDYNSKSFEKFFDDVRDLKISPDSKKLVYFSDYEIWILFLKEKFDQPQRKDGEKVFLMRLSEKIQDVFWLNSDYLVFNTGSKIKISEIDDRDKINVIEIKNPALAAEIEIFWNQIDKKIYLLDKETLYSSSAVLIP